MHGRSALSTVRSWWLAAALVLLQLTSHAETAAVDGGFAQFMRSATGAGATTVGFGSTGTPIAKPTPTLTLDGTGGALFKSGGTIPNPAGNPVAVTATGRMSAAAMGSALAKFAVGLYWPVAAASAVYGLLQTINGLYAEAGPDGTSTRWYTITQTQTCVAGTCYQYWADTPGGTGFQGWSGTSDAACKKARLAYNALANGQGTYWMPKETDAFAIHTDPRDQYCQYNIYNRSTGAFYGYMYNPATYQIVAQDPSVTKKYMTQQELADQAAAKLWGPADETNVLKAFKEVAKANGTGLAPDGAVTVTGPATSTGSSTTSTSTNPDGSTRTETKTCSYTHTYAGDKMTTAENCTTSVTNDGVAGKTTSAATTKAGTDETKPKDSTNQCEVNPDSAGCAKLGEAPNADPLSKTTKSLGPITPVTFTGGTCPSPVAFSAFNRSYSFAYTPLCDKLASLAPLFLALATLAAAWIMAEGFKVS
jgi:hypothetical protein